VKRTVAKKPSKTIKKAGAKKTVKKVIYKKGKKK
jgi:hypothetical protein